MADHAQLLKDFGSLLSTTESKINNNIDQKFKILQNKMSTLENENKKIKEKIQHHEDKLTSMESKEKTTEKHLSFLVYGLKGDYYGTVLEDIIKILRDIDIDVSKYCIKYIYKIGKKKWNQEGPIKVTVTSNILRNEIMKKKFKLKGREIQIREDLTKEERKTREKLAKFSIEAKNNGKKVYMKDDKLVIEGKIWSLENLEKGEHKKHENSTKNNENNQITESQGTEDDDIIMEENTSTKENSVSVNQKRAFSELSPETMKVMETPEASQTPKKAKNMQPTLHEILGTNSTAFRATFYKKTDTKNNPTNDNFEDPNA